MIGFVKKIFFIFCLFFSLQVWAFQNPVKDFRIFLPFCGAADGNFNTGIDLYGNQAVFAVADGTIIFTDCDVVIIDHGDNIQTVYKGLKPDFKSFYVQAGDCIGFVPGDNMLHFEIFDGTMKRLINPLLMLDGKKDKFPPEIQNVIMQTGEMTDLESFQNIDAQKTKFYILLSDKHLEDSTPYNISIYINGREIDDYNFTDIQLVEGEFILNSMGMLLKDIYQIPGMIYIGEIEFKQGKSILEVEVSDFYGNKNSKTFVFMAK